MGNSNILWRPFQESVQRLGDAFYYATMRGISIVEIKDGKYKVIYSGNDDKMWGAFHFSIVYRDNIVFLPHKLSYLYMYNPESEEGKKIEIPARKSDEVLLPYLSGDFLVLFGIKSCRTYVVSPDWSIKLMDNDIKDSQWVTFRLCNGKKKYIDLWNDEGNKIGYIDRNTYSLNELTIPCERVRTSIVEGDRIYILDSQGELLIYDMKGDVQIATVNVGEAGQIQKMLLYDKCLYFMPSVGTTIKVVPIADPYNISQEVVNALSGNRYVSWTDLGDGEVMGIEEDKSMPQKSDLKVFTYNLFSQKYKLVELKKMFSEYCLFDADNANNMIEECSDYNILGMLNRILKDRN